MIKKKILFKRIFFVICVLIGCKAAQSHVIGTRDCGFFSNFFGVLNHLSYCEKNGILPIVYWDSLSPYYDKGGWRGKENVWEYYFEQLGQEIYIPDSRVNRGYKAPDGSGVSGPYGNAGVCVNIEKIKLWAHDLIKKYIKPRSYITEKVERFYNDKFYGKYVIGLHLRGTDKPEEVRSADPLLLIDHALKVARKNKHKNIRFFIATDEERLLKLAKSKLGGLVIAYPSQRSGSNIPLHLGKEISNKPLAGEEILIEVLLLARTDYFIHTCSNVSNAVLCFNPQLKHIDFGPFA